MKFTMNMRLLKAVVCGASKEETRYYLKGVCFEPKAEAIYLCSTDGHMLIAARHEHEPDERPEQDLPAFIIPLDLIKSLKLNKAIDLGTVEMVNGLVSLHYFGTSITAPIVDGTFPDWRRVVPDTINGAVAHYNPRLAVRFSDARDALVGKDSKACPQIHHNGDNPALVSFGIAGERYEIVGVIMPMRGSDDAPIYSWAKHRPWESKAA